MAITLVTRERRKTQNNVKAEAQLEMMREMKDDDDGHGHDAENRYDFTDILRI